MKRRRGVRRGVWLGLLTAVLLGVLLTPLDPLSSGSRTSAARNAVNASAQATYNAAEHLGVYVGAANPAAVRQFETWLGRPVSQVLEFLPERTWAGVDEPGYFLRTWSRSRYRARVVYSVPLLPLGQGTLEQGAAGAFDAHFRRLARLLVRYRQGRAILRLGWEFNGNWYPWSAASDPAAFAAYWRQVVTTMRSVRGARGLRFDWCPNLGANNVAAPLAYPGDAYVDFIGIDAYDQGWMPGWSEPSSRWKSLLEGPYGLKWQIQFAAAHHKLLSMPEWGLAVRPDGHGGGDDPYYISQIWNWLQTRHYSYSDYFEFDAEGRQHTLLSGQFPQATAVFRQLYGRAQGGGG